MPQHISRTVLEAEWLYPCPRPEDHATDNRLVYTLELRSGEQTLTVTYVVDPDFPKEN